MRGKAALILSVTMGVLAVVMMSVYIKSRENSLLQLSTMKDVLVATQDILANSAVDERMIQRVQVPAKYVQPQAIVDARDLVGRVVAVPVPKGGQILGTYLENAGETALAYEVPRGRRAVTIAVSDVTGVGGLVRPGNFVDVMGTFEYGRPLGTTNGRMQYADERTETRVLVQNMQVVAVGKTHRGERAGQALNPAQQADADADAARARQQDARSVTMLAGPEQAQQLVLAQQIGTLTLTLRSNLDAGQMLDLGSLDPFGLLNVQIPLKSRAAPVWREIRGSGGPGF
jgi:pilus assembly protein CpaB